MIKAKAWDGGDLAGTWEVTLKIDGVRALWFPEKGGWYSRAGKPLYGIPSPRAGDPTDVEVYLGSFKETIQAVRTKNPTADTPLIHRRHLYGLDPVDPRLSGVADVGEVPELPGLRLGVTHGVWRNGSLQYVDDPTTEQIRAMLKVALGMGCEGLVLRGEGDMWLKVKPQETHDVVVTGAIEGTGKHQGRLGALMTEKGKVGTGFLDGEREELWAMYDGGWEGNDLQGQVVEVACMHLTEDGQFRHPRFVRMRPDKAGG